MAGIRDRMFYKERLAIDLEHNGLLTKRKVIRRRKLVEFNLVYLLHILMLIFHLQRQCYGYFEYYRKGITKYYEKHTILLRIIVYIRYIAYLQYVEYIEYIQYMQYI
jgi:hypothetical protein